jgi:hypothetical protein
MQLLGTTFLLLDSIRVGVRLPKEGIRLGDPAEVSSWLFQWASPVGFGLLLIGFVLSGASLLLSRHITSTAATDAPQKSSFKDSAIEKELDAIQTHAIQTMPVLNFLAERVDREQEIFWHRFYSFATLHAGAFVLASALRPRWPIAVAGFALALIWCYVQWLSLKYVDRLKPLYHVVLQRSGIQFVQPEWLSTKRGLSSSDIGVGVTILIATTWAMVLVIFG